MRFLLLDSQSTSLTGIKNIILQEYPNSSCDTFQNTDLAFKAFEEKTYLLIVLDINIPGANMHAFIELLLKIRPLQKILIHSNSPESIYAKRLLQVGVKGYVHKTQPTGDFLLAIKTIVYGRHYLSNKLIEKISDDFLYCRSDNPFDKLSKREMEVCQFIIKGYRLTDMAATMHLHKSTIGTHQSRILNKLGVEKTFEVRELAAAYSIPLYD
jgi:DNA-binding NarL/FixJ family response regulator